MAAGPHSVLAALPSHLPDLFGNASLSFRLRAASAILAAAKVVGIDVFAVCRSTP